MSAITKAVFDTNIFVSGIFWKGPPYRCVMAAEAGSVEGVRILTARQFLDLLPEMSEDAGRATH